MSQQIYFFPWQNPVLRRTIYPHRESKLRDFLLIYKEVDLWSQLREKEVNDPEIQSRLEQLEQKVEVERTRVFKALQEGIEKRKKADKWFAQITGTGVGSEKEKNLKFKRLYYLDRMINENTRRLADLESRKETLLRKVDWYPKDDSRRITWENRAKELDSPIEAVKLDLDDLSQLRELFERESRLPKPEKGGPLSIQDYARIELAEYQRELDQMNHDRLLEETWQRLQERLPINGGAPSGAPRFEKWLAYMVIHFSGMRYMSSHGSWADPNDLLELLVREDIKDKINPGEDIDDRVEAELQRLLSLPANSNTRNLDASLRALLYFKQQKERQGEPMPDWVWDEIRRDTQLRLGVTDEEWEKSSPERWRFENRRWREIMANWQQSDITGWRNAHQQTLDLLVTRAVCNEIAEHIQHLRGNVPPGGLTSKPGWYLSLQRRTENVPEDDHRKCYFRRARKERDFINGASVFWLGWVEREPNAWQVANDLPGIDLWPGVNLAGGKPGLNENWSYSKSGAAYIRTRKHDLEIPTVRELRKRGMTDREIESYREKMRSQNTIDKEYLRWKHEAIAVEVVELIDGPHVLTFETGKIGLNWHHVDSLVQNSYDQVFVGFLPKADKEPGNLSKMLDSARILFRPAVQEIPTDLSPGAPTIRDLVGDQPGKPAEPVISLQTGAFPAGISITPTPKYFIYFITNLRKKNIFSGITRNIKVRFEEHISGLVPGVPRRISFNRLVFYQAYECLEDALAVFNLFETFTRDEVADFITANNPDWRDLSEELVVECVEY